MKHLVFFLFLNFLVFESNAMYQTYTDSLIQVLQSTEVTVERIDVLNELAWEFRNSKMEDALEYSNTALKLSSQIKDNKRIATSLKRKGVVLKYLGSYSEALNCYEEALTIEILNNNKKGEASCYNNMGNIYQRWGENQLALECFINSLKIKEKLYPESINLANTYKNIGHFCFEVLQQFDTAMYYLEQAKEIAIKKKDDALQGLIINDFGLLYHDQEMFGEAFSFFKVAAKKYEILKDSIGLAMVWDNMGRTATYLDDYTLAEHYHRQSLSIKQSREDKLGVGLVYSNLGDLMLKKEDYSEALRYYSKFLDISERAETKNNIVTAYHGIAISYEGLGKLEEALVFRKAYEEANYNLLNELKIRDIEELKIRYNTEKRKKEILALKFKQQLQVQDLERSNQFNNALMVVTGLVVFIAILIIQNHRNKRKASHYLALKIEEINNQRVNDLMHVHELKVMEAVIDSQEIERRRIAQQLHGEVGSILHTIKLYFSSMETKFNSVLDENKEQYKKANELLDKVTNEIRDVSHSLDAGIVNNLGIIAALEELADNIQKSDQMFVTVESFNMEERLDIKKEILIYRIIQELVSNVLKHAKAENLHISLTRRIDELNIMIEDDGVGFEFEEAKQSGGMGFTNISNKVSHLEGDLVFDSKKGHGTTVIININL